MIFCHVAMTAADDYRTRREGYRQAHLERIVGLRSAGAVIGGGPAPDGRTADLFYRAPTVEDVTRLVEDDPYFKGGVWTSYRPQAFERFLEPWQVPPVVIDGSRTVSIVEGFAPDLDMASFALIEARGAGRMAFGGLFPDGRTLVVMRSADPAEAIASLAESGLWKDGSLTARPLLHVL
jgi:hypothetical protein